MNQETFRKQTAIALAALGQHMHEHNLPIPREVEIRPDDQIIRVYLSGLSTHEEWLTSVAVLTENNEYRSPRPGELEPFFRSTWTVLLDLGLRFELVGSRPLPLMVVSA